LFTESLVLREQVGEKLSIVESLEGLAQVAFAQGEAAHGVRLFSATEALRSELGAPLPASYTRERALTLSAARNYLGEAAFRQAWDNGRALSLDEAIFEANTKNHAPISAGMTTGRV